MLQTYVILEDKINFLVNTMFQPATINLDFHSADKRIRHPYLEYEKCIDTTMLAVTLIKQFLGMFGVSNVQSSEYNSRTFMQYVFQRKTFRIRREDLQVGN